MACLAAQPDHGQQRGAACRPGAAMDRRWLGRSIWHGARACGLWRSATHTREQVRHFRASPELLLAYHDAAYEQMRTYLKTLTAEELARQLDEPQYQPLPTVAVRLVSVLENAMTNEGQISYLKAYHRLG